MFWLHGRYRSSSREGAQGGSHLPRLKPSSDEILMSSISELECEGFHHRILKVESVVDSQSMIRRLAAAVKVD